jgi:hypothetical protein
MLEIAALLGVFLVLGIVFLLGKLLLGLFLIPLKIGIGALKLLVFIFVGIPLLILGCLVLGVLLPAALVLLPVLAIGGAVVCLVILPFVLVFKAFS